MKTLCSMLAVGLLLLTAEAKGQAQTSTPLPNLPLVTKPLPNVPLPNAGLGMVSNLKFTGDAQTQQVWFRRGYYRGYGYRGYGYGYRGYGYGGYYRPYYYGYGYRPYYGYGYNSYGYCNPYSYGYGYGYPYSGYGYGSPYSGYGYAYRPYYGYGYGYPYLGRRIVLTQAAPPATTLAAVPQQPRISGPIQLTQFTLQHPNGAAVTTPADPNRSYPYDGGPQNVVPLPNNGKQQFNIPAPSTQPERPIVPRDGVPVSIPRGFSGEVSAVYYGGTAPAATPISTRVEYPAYGEPR